MQSYDRDGVKATPFLEAFMAYERSTYHGKSIDDIGDIRIGQWIFLYVVLQSLPLITVDAPGVRWTQGVEYFLCEVPKGTPPWLREETGNKALYRVAGGSGVVSLPADAVENSVDGFYHRSHCWRMAQVWSGGDAVPPLTARPSFPMRTASKASSFADDSAPDLTAPPVVGQETFFNGSPNVSPRHSVALGLEPLPLPPPILANEFPANRKVSTPDPTRSFDNILGPATPAYKKKGWGSFSGGA